MTAAKTSLEHPATSPEPAGGGIVFFDGVCGFCNGTVNFLMARDAHARLKFSPLQGETAAKILDTNDVRELKSLVFLKEGIAYRRSGATVRILWQLGGFWGMLGSLLWLVPLPIRDLAYRIVATNRYRWFGKKETCRMPTAEERSRFLP